VATAGTSSSWGIKGGKCDGARVLFSSGDPMDMTYTVPPSGSITVRVAWSREADVGQVCVTPDCTCAVICYTSHASGAHLHPLAHPHFHMWRVISSVCMTLISSICMALAFVVFA
jgi:hypothetical protein